MQKHDAGGALVYLLSTVTTRANECLLDVGLTNAEGNYPLHQLRFLVGRNGERSHTGKGNECETEKQRSNSTCQLPSVFRLRSSVFCGCGSAVLC